MTIRFFTRKYRKIQSHFSTNRKRNKYVTKSRKSNKKINYKFKFIVSTRFIPDSLSNLVDNISE